MTGGAKLIITGGTISNNKAESEGGGGLYAGDENTAVTLGPAKSASDIKVKIEKNTAKTNGGGVACLTASLSASNVEFNENEAEGNGGGVYHCIASNNGGEDTKQTTLTLASCKFTANKGTGPNTSYGGGVYCGKVTVDNCIFYNNTVKDNERDTTDGKGKGAAIYCAENGLTVGNESKPGTAFKNNSEDGTEVGAFEAETPSQ